MKARQLKTSGRYQAGSIRVYSDHVDSHRQLIKNSKKQRVLQPYEPTNKVVRCVNNTGQEYQLEEGVLYGVRDITLSHVALLQDNDLYYYARKRFELVDTKLNHSDQSRIRDELRDQPIYRVKKRGLLGGEKAFWIDKYGLHVFEPESFLVIGGEPSLDSCKNMTLRSGQKIHRKCLEHIPSDSEFPKFVMSYSFRDHPPIYLVIGQTDSSYLLTDGQAYSKRSLVDVENPPIGGMLMDDFLAMQQISLFKKASSGR